MSTVFPYMLGPMALSSHALYKTHKARASLAQLEALGYKPRKRDAVSGAVVGTLQKLPVTFLLWGHDELFFAADAMLETFPTHPLLTEGAVEAIGAHDEVLQIGVFEGVNGVANAGVEGLQGLLGIEGAEDRIADEAAGEVDDGGWHDTGENIAQNLLLVAPVAAVIDKVADYPFDRWDQRKPMKGDIRASSSSSSSSQVPPPLPPRPKK